MQISVGMYEPEQGLPGPPILVPDEYAERAGGEQKDDEAGDRLPMTDLGRPQQLDAIHDKQDAAQTVTDCRPFVTIP